MEPVLALRRIAAPVLPGMRGSKKMTCSTGTMRPHAEADLLLRLRWCRCVDPDGVG